MVFFPLDGKKVRRRLSSREYAQRLIDCTKMAAEPDEAGLATEAATQADGGSSISQFHQDESLTPNVDAAGSSAAMRSAIILSAVALLYYAYRKGYLDPPVARLSTMISTLSRSPTAQRLFAKLSPAVDAVTAKYSQLRSHFAPSAPLPAPLRRVRADSDINHSVTDGVASLAPAAASNGSGGSSSSSSAKPRRLAGRGVSSIELRELDREEDGNGDDEDDEESHNERTPLTASGSSSGNAGADGVHMKATAAIVAAVPPSPSQPPPSPPSFLPSLVGLDPDVSPLLSPSDIRALYAHLPSRCQGKDWSLLFSTDRDGYNLYTLYARVQHQGPSLVLVQTDTGALVAGFASRDWSGSDVISGGGAAVRVITGMASAVASSSSSVFSSPATKPGRGGGYAPLSSSSAFGGSPASSPLHSVMGGPTIAHTRVGGGSGNYFGTGESFIATLQPGPVTVHRWTRYNNYFLLARADCLAFGGSRAGGSDGHSSSFGGLGLSSSASGGGSGGGGGGGGFGLWLDSGLEHGFSGTFDTFGNRESLVRHAPAGDDVTASAADYDGGRFRILRVEVYGFVVPHAHHHATPPSLTSRSRGGGGGGGASAAGSAPFSPVQGLVASLGAYAYGASSSSSSSSDDGAHVVKGAASPTTIGSWGRLLTGGLSPVRTAAHSSAMTPSGPS